MSDYRLYLFNQRGGIQRAVAVDCESDDEAVDAARAEHWPHQVEIWRRGRLVSLLVPPSPEAQGA